AYVCAKVFSTSYFARQDTKTPVKIAVICALTNIALALVLIQFMGVIGIAFSTGLCGWLQFCLLLRGLRRDKKAEFDGRFAHSWPRLVFSSCVMALVLA